MSSHEPQKSNLRQNLEGFAFASLIISPIFGIGAHLSVQENQKHSAAEAGVRDTFNTAAWVEKETPSAFHVKKKGEENIHSVRAYAAELTENPAPCAEKGADESYVVTMYEDALHTHERLVCRLPGGKHITIK
ncbi:MAG: hypothetical protein OXT65_01915 [Alphaproteobacteria bacterium]|nr:hypothetical protein [Alphaproteobacteria bacterium]